WNSAAQGHRAIALSKDTTVFQAELYAILETVRIISERGYTGVRIKILSDSQSVLKVLSSCSFTFSLVLECHNELNQACNPEPHNLDMGSGA
ncbi:hypothetical protein EVAR_73506_1, partial [Eumeta japonica]